MKIVPRKRKRTRSRRRKTTRIAICDQFLIKKIDKPEKSDSSPVIDEGSLDTKTEVYLDHTLTTPAIQPEHCTLLEESWIALTANSKLAAGEVHYDGHVQVSLNTCSQR